MKKFTMTIDKNDYTNTRSAVDNDYVRDMIYNNMIKKHPYFGSNTNSVDNVIFMANPYVAATDTSYNPIASPYSIFDTDVVKNNGDIFLVLKDNKFNIVRDDYDFRIGNTPVKIYDKYVQVGYNIIPRDEFPRTVFLNHNHRYINKTVIDIIIKVKKTSLLF